MKISQQRQNCAALIENEFADMKQVALPVEYFGRAQNTIAHLGFAITISSTQAGESRQRTQAALVNKMQIIFAYRLRPHSLLVDLDAATDREENIIRAILDNQANISTPKTQLRYMSTARDFADSLEYVVLTIEFQTMHQLEN